jgi:hypothetical protein
MESSLRNEKIRDGIAEAFLEAVCQFCNHPTLQYKWPRYIPQKISNPFWKCLEDNIHELLKGRAILRGHRHGPLWPISQLKKIEADFKDESGNPLVADLDEEMYLASEYAQEDIAVLKSLGLGVLKFDDVIARFQHDLNQPSSKSRFKSPETDDYWHTQTAKLLLRPFKEKWSESSTVAVRRLNCIPLQNGEWTAIADGAVFFPYTDGILIPTDLGLRIVDGKSITNPTREKLFITLGVKFASIQDITALILGRYKKESSSIGFETSLKDLCFLYSTYAPGKTVNLRESTSLWVFNHRDHRSHDEEDLYFQSDEEYGFQELMGSVLEVAPHNSGRTGSFIHPEYCKQIEIFAEKPGGSHSAFKAWLQECIGILKHPRLVDPKDLTQLSPIFQYIIDSRPDKLLGTLKAHWSSYEAMISTSLASTISNVKVRTNISSTPLGKTFIPSESLTNKCAEFLDIQKFPFLELENEPDTEGWRFLSKFHVGVELSLDFWLQILYYCSKSDGPFRYEIYEVIQRELWVGTSYEDLISVRYELSCILPLTHSAIYSESLLGHALGILSGVIILY